MKFQYEKGDCVIYRHLFKRPGFMFLESSEVLGQVVNLEHKVWGLQMVRVSGPFGIEVIAENRIMREASALEVFAHEVSRA
jgi:hypothetical protein